MIGETIKQHILQRNFKNVISTISDQLFLYLRVNRYISGGTNASIEDPKRKDGE